MLFERNNQAIKRNYNFLSDKGYSQSFESVGKNFRITIKAHKEKKKIPLILSQNSIVEHIWAEFICIYINLEMTTSK